MEEDNNYYESRLDKIFGNRPNWKHRTFRTILDPYSSEWNETSYDKKMEILKKVIDAGEDMEVLIHDYKKRYEDQNRKDISSTVEHALITLLEHSLTMNSAKK